MPRYFFNIIRNGETVYDDEGMDLSSEHQIEQEAIASARELIAEAVREGNAMELDLEFAVSDTHGNIVYTLPFKDVIVA